MRAVLRRTRYGYLLAFHILLLCAAGRTPTEIAAFLFCSRSSVYRIVRAYRAGSLGIRVDQDGQLSIAVRLTVLMPWLMRSLSAVLKAAPRTYGWCRTRWSCATLAATLQAKHGLEVSAETVRRWLHEMGWVWKRAKLVAKDDDPHRIARLARLRFHEENLQPHEVMVFADELDSSPPAEGGSRLDAPRHAGRDHDTGEERETLSGWGTASGDGPPTLLPWAAQKQWLISGPLRLAGYHVPRCTDYAPLRRRG